jgi:acetyl esterase/lipase
MDKRNQTTEKITKEMTFGEVYEIPKFKVYQNYLMYRPGSPKMLAEPPFSNLRLSEISTFMPTWDGETIAMGLNRLLELEKLGKKVKYDIWNLQEREEFPEKNYAILFHLPSDEWKPFIVVCAGGAYREVASMVEAFPTAKHLNDLGYNVFVLNYRVGKENLYPAPNEDLTQAIKFVLSHSEQFKVSKESYAVAGFSAGGHLVATLGTKNFGYKKSGLPKPAALFLGYPIISLGELFEKNKGRITTQVAGNSYTPEIHQTFSIDQNMNKDYPPTYIWMCKDDEGVPFSNSMIMAEQLKKLGVPYIHKVVEHGGHGIGLGLGTEAVDFWEKQIR